MSREDIFIKYFPTTVSDEIKRVANKLEVTEYSVMDKALMKLYDRVFNTTTSIELVPRGRVVRQKPTFFKNIWKDIVRLGEEEIEFYDLCRAIDRKGIDVVSVLRGKVKREYAILDGENFYMDRSDHHTNVDLVVDLGDYITEWVKYTQGSSNRSVGFSRWEELGKYCVEMSWSLPSLVDSLVRAEYNKVFDPRPRLRPRKRMSGGNVGKMFERFSKNFKSLKGEWEYADMAQECGCPLDHFHSVVGYQVRKGEYWGEDMIVRGDGLTLYLTEDEKRLVLSKVNKNTLF